MSIFLQVDYPKLVSSKVVISVSKDASADLNIIMDGLIFQNSYWMIFSLNIEIINCHTASLVLELKCLTHAIIQNCTFGNWTFVEVQNAFIRNCNNIFNERISTSLNFYNSSAYIENMTIQHDDMTGDFNIILVYNHSLSHIEQSKFVKQ